MLHRHPIASHRIPNGPEGASHIEPCLTYTRAVWSFCEAVSLMFESPTLIVIPFIPHGFQGHGLLVGRPMQRTLNGELFWVLR